MNLLELARQRVHCPRRATARPAVPKMAAGATRVCIISSKEDLQKLARELGVSLTIAHYPAYCSKYNPIEHRLFCQIQRSWDGMGFESYERVQEQVEKTTIQTGLKVVAWLNDKVYQTARKYSQDFRENMKIEFDQLLPKWNYIINHL
ncbi:MAG: ISAzo13-like element transposase-related protein [Gemmatimonadaceae bacterium]